MFAPMGVALALVMTPKPGWHGYWENPGDAGAPTRIAWSLPQGVKAGPIHYPVPERLLISGLMNYVYQGPYAELTDVAVPAGLAAGTRLPLRASVDYLVCTDRICVPYLMSAAGAASTPIGGSGARMRTRWRRQRLHVRWLRRRRSPQGWACRPAT